MKKYLILPLLGVCVGCQTIDQGAADSRTVHASYYYHGSRTASGAKFNPHGLSAAHKTLPFGTKVRVTNPRNNKSIVVVINDRGPFIKGREIDLSLGAAKALGIVQQGVANIQMEILTDGG